MNTVLNNTEREKSYERINDKQLIIECSLTGKFLLLPQAGKILPIGTATEDPLFHSSFQRVLEEHLITKPLPLNAAAAKIKAPYNKRRSSAKILRSAWDIASHTLPDTTRVVFVLPGIRDLITLIDGQLAIRKPKTGTPVPDAELQTYIETLSILLTNTDLVKDYEEARSFVSQYLRTIAYFNLGITPDEVPSISEGKQVPLKEEGITLRRTDQTLPPQGATAEPIEKTHEYSEDRENLDDFSEWGLDLVFWNEATRTSMQSERICKGANFTNEEIQLLRDYFTKHTKRDREINKLINRLTISVALFADNE